VRRRPIPEAVEPLLRVLGPELRRVILTEYKADSCIASTRIGIDLLAELGVPARPLRVEVMAYTVGYARRIEAEGRMPRNQAERIAWTDETNGWALGIGVEAGTPGGIHLVALVDDHLLWDLSIDQASRPERNMPIEGPIVLDTDDAFRKGRRLLRVTDDKTILVYRVSKLKGMPWSQSNNWRKDGRDAQVRQAIVQEALRAIDDAKARSALRRVESL